MGKLNIRVLDSNGMSVNDLLYFGHTNEWSLGSFCGTDWLYNAETDVITESGFHIGSNNPYRAGVQEHDLNEECKTELQRVRKLVADYPWMKKPDLKSFTTAQFCPCGHVTDVRQILCMEQLHDKNRMDAATFHSDECPDCREDMERDFRLAGYEV